MRTGKTDAPAFVLVPFKDVHPHGNRWLIKGLLASSGLAVIFGAKKNFKSFVALDVALHIASGRSWAGRKVRQGAVVYIVAEGANGFDDRVAANRTASAYAEDLPFYLIRARPNLGNGPEDAERLIKAISAVISVPIAAVFVDTLVRTLAGGSENDSGMHSFINNVEGIADHFGCLAIAIHHVGKDASRGMRGNSALPGAVVTSWLVEKIDRRQARITIDDVKDSEGGLACIADLRSFTYGSDEDGEQETVLIVDQVRPPQIIDAEAELPKGDRAKPIPPQVKIFMAAFADAAKMSIEGQSLIVEVKKAYDYHRGNKVNPDALRKSFKNSLNWAIKHRLLSMTQSDVGSILSRAQ